MCLNLFVEEYIGSATSREYILTSAILLNPDTKEFMVELWISWWKLVGEIKSGRENGSRSSRFGPFAELINRRDGRLQVRAMDRDLYTHKNVLQILPVGAG